MVSCWRLHGGAFRAREQPTGCESLAALPALGRPGEQNSLCAGARGSNWLRRECLRSAETPCGSRAPPGSAPRRLSIASGGSRAHWLRGIPCPARSLPSGRRVGLAGSIALLGYTDTRRAKPRDAGSHKTGLTHRTPPRRRARPLRTKKRRGTAGARPETLFPESAPVF